MLDTHDATTAAARAVARSAQTRSAHAAVSVARHANKKWTIYYYAFFNNNHHNAHSLRHSAHSAGRHMQNIC